MIWIINALNSYDNKNTENQQNISELVFFFLLCACEMCKDLWLWYYCLFTGHVPVRYKLYVIVILEKVSGKLLRELKGLGQKKTCLTNFNCHL